MRSLFLVLGVVSAQMPDWERMGVPLYTDTDISLAPPVGPKMAGSVAIDMDEALGLGPKVNGGEAEAATPAPGVNHRNADCVGRLIDGNCVKFPTKTRTADVDDVMVSPEQLAPSKYEADIHLFVKKHFGQDVMVNMAPELHHPSEGVTEAGAIGIMNREDNVVPNQMAANLIPLGSGMMTSGDMEVAAVIDPGNMARPPTMEDMQATVHAIRDIAEEAGMPADDAIKEAVQPKVTVKNAGAWGNAPSADEEVAPVDDSLDAVLQPPAPFEVEEVTPFAEVSAAEREEELPPTPTPTPTPNREAEAAAAAAAAAKMKGLSEAIRFLHDNDIYCTGNTPADNLVMSMDTPVVVEAPTTVDDAFDPSDIRGNFQALVLQCTADAAASVTSATYANPEIRELFSAKLERYATAMACVDRDFPACIPEGAAEIISQDPRVGDDGVPRDKWPCW